MSVTLSMQNTTTVVESISIPLQALVKFNHKINYVLIFQIPASIVQQFLTVRKYYNLCT
jgi:hypothetical protein